MKFIIALVSVVFISTTFTTSAVEAKDCTSALTCSKPGQLAGVKPHAYPTKKCTSAFTCKPNHLAGVKAPALPNTGK